MNTPIIFEKMNKNIFEYTSCFIYQEYLSRINTFYNTMLGIHIA